MCGDDHAAGEGARMSKKKLTWCRRCKQSHICTPPLTKKEADKKFPHAIPVQELRKKLSKLDCIGGTGGKVPLEQYR